MHFVALAHLHLAWHDHVHGGIIMRASLCHPSSTNSQVVAEGLGTIMPLLPPDLPAHPKLCHSFFDTVAFMLEVSEVW